MCMTMYYYRMLKYSENGHVILINIRQEINQMYQLGKLDLEMLYTKWLILKK